MFGSVEDDSERFAASRRPMRLSAGLALALHGAAAILVVGSAAGPIEDPPEPLTPIRFVAPAFPPPPGGDRPSSARPSRARSFEPETFRRVAPLKVRQTTTGALETAPTGGRDEGLAQGTSVSPDGIGNLQGVPGGTSNGELAGARTDEILRPGGEVREPVLVLRAEPSYPETARRIRAEGVVVLDAVISASGRVEDVRVLRSVHPLLDGAAVHAVEGWRYRPAILNGRAARVFLTVTVAFSLR